MDRKVLPCGCEVFRDKELTEVRFVRYCRPHAKEHGTDLEAQSYMMNNNPLFEATDADLERVAICLKNGRVATIVEISDALGVMQIEVALSIDKRSKKILIDKASEKSQRYFSRIWNPDMCRNLSGPT